MLNRIIIRTTLIIFILAGIGGYSLFEARNLLSGPTIIIEQPLNGQLSNTPVTDISGNVRNSVRISMNDRSILIDENGNFREKFVLSTGSNTVKISAEDRFGRNEDAFVQIFYAEPNEQFASVITNYQ